MWHYFSTPFSITLDTQQGPIPVPELQSFAYVAQTFIYFLFINVLKISILLSALEHLPDGHSRSSSHILPITLTHSQIDSIFFFIVVTCIDMHKYINITL